MKIAIETTLFDFYSLENAFKKIRRTGYKYVEICSQHFIPYNEPKRAKQLVRLLKDSNLELASILITWIPLALIDEEERKERVQEMEKSIHVLASVGCKLITCARALTGNIENREEHAIAFKRSITELTTTLEENDICISFECHPGDFVKRSEEAIDLLRDTSHVGYLFCSPHTFLFDSDPQTTLEYSKELLTHVHIADTYKPKNNGDHQHLIPGLGEIDFEKIFRTLKKIGYVGFVSATLFTHRDKPVAAAIETKKRIEGFLGL